MEENNKALILNFVEEEKISRNEGLGYSKRFLMTYGYLCER